MRGFFLGGLCALGLVIGCGPAPEKMFKVSGAVSLDGKPLSSGEVAFMDEAGKAPAIFTITNGQFEGPSSGGKKKVQITSYKEEEMKLPKGVKAGPGQEAGKKTMVNILPEKYSTESKLTEEVKQEGQKFEFKLESK